MKIPALTLAVQSKATDPAASSFVAANAGSGKTHVLARRVVRLLMSGCKPEKLLCLTFTKAAAAEMSIRVFRDLAAFALAGDADLLALIAEIDGRAPSPAALPAARKLFARALETPGGLKIQTIHAFCESLLQRFPLEANVAGRFTVLDERTAAEWQAEAFEAVVLAARDDEGPLGAAFGRLVREMSDEGLSEMVSRVIAFREVLDAWKARAGGLAGALAALGPDLSQDLGIDPAATVESVRREIGASPLFTPEFLARLTTALDAGGDRDRALAEAIVAARPDPDGIDAEAWLKLFFTEGKPRSFPHWASKAVRDRLPDLEQKFADECRRLAKLDDRWRAIDTKLATATLLTFADAILERFEARKAREGALDFTDLIARTADLLEKSEAAAWVQYKLDSGLEHVLIDEAQDTSPLQWRVIAKLTDEFFTGRSLRAIDRRTVFAVGDEKQSIYSFQGARPETFERERRAIGRRAVEAGATFHDLRLELSFRSTPEIVSFVDEVFAPPEARKGLSSADDDRAPHHTPQRMDARGRVELWPEILQAAKARRENWLDPVDETVENSASNQLAGQMAATIAGWLRHGEPATDGGRPIRAGDILVLVRKRDGFVGALSRALHAAGVPVAGADRLVISEHIVAADLNVIAGACLNPHDDLSVATMLKTPFFELDDDDLMVIAPGRKGSLRAALAARAEEGTSPRLAAAEAKVRRLEARAAAMGPFDFFAALTGEDGARPAWTARFGPEAGEVIDEFLNLCLEFERDNCPSLNGFLAWAAAARTEVKREMESGRDEVRIMTVHGAKGLEAPVVFVVDGGGAVVSSTHLPRLMAISEGETAALARVLPGKRSPAIVVAELERWKAAQHDEYRRLLYVALTRPRDRLIVCGYAGPKAPKSGRWHQLATAAFERLDAGGLVGEEARDGALAARIYRHPPRPAAPDIRIKAAAEPEPFYRPAFAAPGLEEVGGWLSPVPLTTGNGEIRHPERADPDFGPRRRGITVHRLIEVLPAIAGLKRAAAATRIFDDAGAPADERAAMLEEVAGMLAHPDLAPLFGPSARAEVELARVVNGVPFLSRIDRIAVTDDSVIIADFKTTRPVPATAADIAPAHIDQIRAYGRLIAPHYPQKRIVLRLIYSAGPAIFDV